MSVASGFCTLENSSRGMRLASRREPPADFGVALGQGNTPHHRRSSPANGLLKTAD
jgi:hypothetical protein